MLQALREEFGDDVHSFYSADTFNEMKPPSSDPAYLSSVSSAVYQVLSILQHPAFGAHHSCTATQALVLDPCV